MGTTGAGAPAAAPLHGAATAGSTRSPVPSRRAAITPVASGPSAPAWMASARRAPNTMPSSSELEASRLAPWTPVQATSPAAHSPGSAVAPDRSVTTPPER